MTRALVRSWSWALCLVVLAGCAGALPARADACGDPREVAPQWYLNCKGTAPELICALRHPVAAREMATEGVADPQDAILDIALGGTATGGSGTAFPYLAINIRFPDMQVPDGAKASLATAAPGSPAGDLAPLPVPMRVRDGSVRGLRLPKDSRVPVTRDTLAALADEPLGRIASDTLLWLRLDLPGARGTAGYGLPLAGAAEAVAALRACLFDRLP